MERRKAITTATAASLTLLAGAAGMTLSSNIVGAEVNDGVGQLSPVSSDAKPPVAVYLDDQLDLTTKMATRPPVQATDATAVTVSSASGYSDDDEYEDDDHDEHEDHDHDEYEGRDDDD